MCMEKSDWEKCIDFHGHSCPGLAIGYRVAKAALERLGEIRSEDEELVAIVENDACGVDAIMYLTGCTLGKGNLLYRDYGKQVYTFGSRNKNKALRIAVKDQAWRGQEDPEFNQLRARIFGGNASEEDQKKFREHQERRTRTILEMPVDELLKIEIVDLKLPPKARIFASAVCAECGENVMEARARVKNGKIVCIPCAGEYTRGW